MTAPDVKIQNLAPVIPFNSVASRSTSRRLAWKDGRDNGGQSDCECATTLGIDRNGFGWTAINIGHERESKVAREILDTIDTETLRAARLNGGATRQLEINRDKIAGLLGLKENWKRPDEVYADEAWEICVIWRSEFGKVEIGTEEDGSVSYFVSRTLGEEKMEGSIEGRDANKLSMIFSWLESDQVDN